MAGPQKIVLLLQENHYNLNLNNNKNYGKHKKAL